MLKQKWHLLSLKEQRLILVGGFLILVFSGYFYVWKPYTQTIDNYTQKVTTLQADVAWLKEIKQRVGQFETRTKQVSVLSSTSLINIIDKSIRKNRLAKNLDVLKKSGTDQVLVVFENIQFDTLIKWLIHLSRQSGIKITAVDIQKSINRGLVSARLTLTK